MPTFCTMLTVGTRPIIGTMPIVATMLILLIMPIRLIMPIVANRYLNPVMVGTIKTVIS